MTINMAAPLEIGLCVRDMTRMVDFYTKVLGFSYISFAEAASENSRLAGFTPSGYEIVRLQTNYGERIKLNRPLEPPRERSDDAYILDRQGTAYLTFIVNALDEIVAGLKKAGVPVLPNEGTVEVRPGVRLCTARDPEGNHLEFVEYADISVYRNDLFDRT